MFLFHISIYHIDKVVCVYTMLRCLILLLLFLSFTLDLLIIKKRSSLVIIIVEDVNAREKCMTILWLDIHINIATPQQQFWFQILHCNDCITWTLSSSYNFLIVSAVSLVSPAYCFIFSDRCNLLRTKYSYLHFNVVFLFIYVTDKGENNVTCMQPQAREPIWSEKK